MRELEFNNNRFYVKVEYDQQQNIEANTSTIAVTGVQVMSTSYFGVPYYLRGAVIVGDKRISVDNKDVTPQKIGEYASVNNASGSVTIQHSNDGTLTTTIGVEISGYTTSGGAGSGWKVTGTESVTLETIPRASTIFFAADTVLGTSCRVQWAPLSADFKYKLEFKMGKGVQTTDFIQPNTTRLYTYTDFTIPLDAAAVIPEKTQETMTVTLYTYSASEEQIGEADTEEFTVTVPDNDFTKPIVSIDALTPVTTLSSPFDTIFVQGKSKVKASYKARGKYGAIPKSYSVSVNGKPSEDTSDYLSEYGTIPVKVTAVDSRGFSNSVTKTIEVLPYAKPRIVPVDGEEVICTRCDAYGNPIDTGTLLRVKAKISYSKVESGSTQNNFGRLFLIWKLASEPDSAYSDPIELICTNDTYDGVFNSVEFNEKASYIVQIIVKDDVGESASMTFTILSEKVYWHRGDGFLALGMRRNSGGFEVAWDTRFYGDVYVGELSLEDYIKKIIQGG